MNRKISVTLLAALILGSLTACSEKNEEGESSPKSGFSAAWQTPFSEKLLEFKSSTDFDEAVSAFDIADITGDSVPELIISTDVSGADACRIFALDGDSVKEIGNVGSCGKFGYIPELNVIRDEYVGSGFVLGKIISCDGSELVSQMTYSDNSASASSGAAIYHKINDKEMLLADYQEAMSAYDGKAEVELGRRYSFGEETMDYALNTAESWGDAMNKKQKKLCREKLEEILASTEENAAEPAFDLVDLNGDGIPELLVSSGTADESGVQIYYLTGDTISLMEGEYGFSGTFDFDPKERVFAFISQDSGNMSYWSIANPDFDAASYDENANRVLCGRRYPLTDAGISAVFE